MRGEPFSDALRIALIYLIIGLIYIYTSDRIVGLLRDPDLITSLQTYKGIAFITVSSILIFYLVWKSHRENQRLMKELEAKIKERTRELEEAKTEAEAANRQNQNSLPICPTN